MEKAHKQLEVWKKSIELVKAVYEVTRDFPPDEKYGLVAQMRRAALSIPSNVAEGAARQTNRDSLQFFIVARGSLSELDTHVEVCKSLVLMKDESRLLLEAKMDAVDSLLSGLIRYRRSKKA